jgi:phosphatidylserine decarboxylase
MPKYLLTALVFHIARIRQVGIKNFLIRRFVGLYNINVEELSHPVPDGFPSLNAFFTRELAADARSIEDREDIVVSPVDGTVSAAGTIERGRLFQAKGIDYALSDLLATDIADADRFAGGSFATIYLAPYNYHRVHAPMAGELVSATYVPGNLYSVNDATVRQLRDLFIGNERLICHFDGLTGPFAMIFVGALNVGTINTIWTGDIRPRKNGVAESIDIANVAAPTETGKGDTIGWFNMGSTVILLAPPGGADYSALSAGETVLVGQRIGTTSSA